MEPVYTLPGDTPQPIREMQASIVLQKTLSERLQMCADVTELPIEMLKRHIKSQNPDIQPNCSLNLK
jgi:hypothetical protein